jgi:nucleotide-binding universal stress UspA family protein
MDATTVVGFDGSAGARAALRWALGGATGPDAKVEVVATWRAPVAAAPPWVVVPVLDEAELAEAHRRTMQEQVDATLGSEAQRASLEVRIVPGPAGPTLVEVAAGAHVLALGRRGHGGFLGLLLGSVSDYCAHHATCPVALVPGEGPAASGRIVVGMDGSPGAEAALRWAAVEAERRGAELVALHAWSWLDQPIPEGGHFDPEFDEAAARAYAERAVADAGLDRPVTVEVECDLPARALVERSAAGDLVVVGTRGMGAVRQALLGSVSRQLVHHGASAVVVVPKPV